MSFKETKILETGLVERIKKPEQAKEYIQILFENYNKWKPDFFRIIEDDIQAIKHNQRLRHNMKNTTPEHKVFTNNVDNSLDFIKDAFFVKENEFYTDKDSKDLMFEYAKAEFNSRLENSFDEKMFIENELQKFTDFENRAKELQKEVYKNDAVLNEYQRQYENKYGWHFSELEYLRMITGYYHYPEREKNKSFYFLPTLVKQKLLKNYIQDIYNQRFNANTDTRPTGFICNLPPETVEQIFEIMQASPQPQISGKLEDFKAIFSQTHQQETEPVKWLIKHNKKPNKTALFTFIKMMLELDEMPRDYLRKATQLFVCENENIFPKDYTYPSFKEQKSSYLTHFKYIKQTYFPDFLKE